MDQQALKEQVAEAALERVAARHNDRLLLGIGTGTTAECFIRTLPAIRSRIEATVASSERSAALLEELGLPVMDLNSVGPLDVYVDGADEANEQFGADQRGWRGINARKDCRRRVGGVYLYRRREQAGSRVGGVSLTR